MTVDQRFHAATISDPRHTSSSAETRVRNVRKSCDGAVTQGLSCVPHAAGVGSGDGSEDSEGDDEGEGSDEVEGSSGVSEGEGESVGGGGSEGVGSGGSVSPRRKTDDEPADSEDQ